MLAPRLITTHLFSPASNTLEVLRTVRERGAKMNFICLHSGREQLQSTVESAQPIAMAHHIGVTDALLPVS